MVAAASVPAVRSAFPVKPPLDFDAHSHTYTVEGRVIPSVTQILKAAKIIDYSGIPQDVLQAASRRGRAVHSAIEYLLEGSLDRTTIDPRIAGYLGAAERFLAEAKVEAHAFERRDYHPELWYAGTFDILGTVQGDLTIADWKTGIQLEGHRDQLAGYAGLHDKPRLYRRMTIYLRDDGTYRVDELRRATFGERFARFTSALEVAKAA